VHVVKQLGSLVRFRSSVALLVQGWQFAANGNPAISDLLTGADPAQYVITIKWINIKTGERK
jgi:hypothetical protein